MVAAGNNGKDVESTSSLRRAAANVLCVGATDDHDVLASFSNIGAASVDLVAPGAYILSSTPGGGYAYSGTSMATPHVAGAAALLAAAQPGSTTAALKAALMSSVDVRGTLLGPRGDRRPPERDRALTALDTPAGGAHADPETRRWPRRPPTPTPTPHRPRPRSPTPAPTVPPTPDPPTTAPITAPAPPVAAPVLRSLKLSGQRDQRRGARVTLSLGADSAVSFSVRCTGARACAEHRRSARWSKSAGKHADGQLDQKTEWPQPRPQSASTR